jgi:phenylacetate-CoA ligase
VTYGGSVGFSGVFNRALFHSFYAISGRAAILSQVDALDELYQQDPSLIRARTLLELDALLKHALRTVRHYREELPITQSDRPDSPYAMLERFPILTKDAIRTAGRRLWSEQPGRKVTAASSGGSTGEPLPLLQDQRMRRCSTLNKLLFMRWLGFKPGELHLSIWGVPEEEFNEPVPIRERIYRSMHNQIYSSCFRMSDDRVRSWIQCVRHYRPSVIEAYVDAIFQMGSTMLREGIRVPPPRGIITGAGVLLPEMRQTIESAFGCPVLDRYGSREVADVACSCPHGVELHVSESMYVVEIVDDAGAPCPPGIEGEVLVTLLTNYTMPLIRYRIEDRASWAEGSCGCGRRTRRLARVAGRSTDVLHAADGTPVNGVGINHLTFSTPGLKRFQYRQTERNRVRLQAVPQSGVEPAVLRAHLAQTLKKVNLLLPGVDIDVTVVDDIVPSRSGKNRFILNELLERPPARSQ